MNLQKCTPDELLEIANGNVTIKKKDKKKFQKDMTSWKQGKDNIIKTLDNIGNSK